MLRFKVEQNKRSFLGLIYMARGLRHLTFSKKVFPSKLPRFPSKTDFRHLYSLKFFSFIL